MRPFAVLAVSLSTLSCAATPAPCPSPPVAPVAPAPPVVSPGAAACAVWDREVAFAKSVQDHDARAFAELVHPGAVFVSEGALQQGRAAVVEGWKGLIAGEKVHLDWHPTSVVITGDPHVALSRGPYWIEIRKPDASPRFLTGVYQSVWVLDADGAWRVTIDGGTPPPAPATEAEVQKIKASLPARCPPAPT